MPLYGEKKAELSMRLTVRIENLVKEFCVEKQVPHSDIPELLDCRAITRLAQNLNLKVKVEELTEEPVTVAVAKETPLEIINRLTTEESNNKEAKSPSSGIEVALTGDPIVIL